MIKHYHTIPIVLSFTSNYFIAAATCILSILKHADEKDTFHFYCLLKEELSGDLRKGLNNLIGSRGKVFYIIVDKSNFDGIKINKRFTEAAYYRLLLSDILIDIDKVLYLDCDIIVRNDLGVLFRNTDVSNYYIAAVKEVPLSFQVDYFISIGCDPYSYINSGVLLMNLKNIREDNVKDSFISVIQKNDFIFPDQDTINIVCKGKIKFLEPYHNSMRTFYLEEYRDAFFRVYDKNDLSSIMEHGTVHFTNKVKPWDAYAINFHIWWNYYTLLPKEIKTRSVVNKNMYWLSKFYNTWIGRSTFDFILMLKRKFKKSVGN